MTFHAEPVELFSAESIAKRVKELAKDVTRDYKNKTLLTVSILKGSVIFTADFVRELDVDIEMAFMSVSSYGSARVTSGNINIRYDVDIPVDGRDVLIIEDIVDTGITLKYVKKHLEDKGAKSVKICTLFDKPSRRRVELIPDYCGFSVEDFFIVGYGLDADNKYRNLKNVCKII